MNYNAVVNVSKSDELPGADDVTEPITLDQAKQWCKIDFPDEDELITDLITAARVICELYANISFIDRTVTATLVNGLGAITLPYGPVKELTSLTGNDNELIDVGDYETRGSLFMQLKTVFCDEVTAVYDAGFDVLPANLKKALLCQVAWMYANRGDEPTMANLSQQSKLILQQVKR